MRSIVLLGAAALVVACSKDFDSLFETGATTGAGGQGAATSGPGAGGETTSTGGSPPGAGGSGGATTTSSASQGGGGSGTGGSPGPCGNDALDNGEECDDGNQSSQDGCSGSCEVEGQADVCPSGVDIDLASPGIWIDGGNAGADPGNDSSCGGNSAGDVVYHVTPAQDGVLQVELTGDYDMVLAVRTACGSGGPPEDFCGTGMGPLTTSFPVVQGEDFHVLVSGFGGAEGDFVLHLFY
jgi:cysteine-rich repeat protein